MEDLYKVVPDKCAEAKYADCYAKSRQAFIIKFLFWAVLYNGRGSTAYLIHTQAQSRTAISWITFLIQLLMMSLLVNSGMTYMYMYLDLFSGIGQKVQMQSVNR